MLNSSCAGRFKSQLTTSAAGAVIAFLSLIDSTAYAQDAEPVRNVELVDQNGVDLQSGALTWKTEPVSIGPVEDPVFSTTAQITDLYNRAGTLITSIQNFTGYLTQPACPPVGEDSCDDHYTATFNGRTASFSSTVFTEPADAVSETGDKIRVETQGVNIIRYVVTDKNGTAFSFAPTTQQTNRARINGRLTQIAYADGRKFDYVYDTQHDLTNIDSNLGYRYIVKGATPGMFNLAHSTCSSTTSCSTTQPYIPNLSINRVFSPTYISNISDHSGRTYVHSRSFVETSPGQPLPAQGYLANNISLPGSLSFYFEQKYYPDEYYRSLKPKISKLIGVNGSWNYHDDNSHYYSTSPLSSITKVSVHNGAGPLYITDALNKTSSITWRYGTYGDSDDYELLDENTRTLPSGLQLEKVFNLEGRVVESKIYPGSASGANIKLASYGYVSSCANPIVCGKPIWSKDANGNQTDYTYDAVHGGLLTETSPADANGIRPQKRYYYEQRYAWVSNGAGGYTQVANPVWKLIRISECRTLSQCSGAVDEIVTEYSYGSPNVSNNLLLTATTIRAGDNSTSKTVALAYDAIGNIISSDGPMAGNADTTYYFYDNARRKTGEVSPDPDGGGTLPRIAHRYTYNSMGFLENEEEGTVTGTDMSGFSTQKSSKYFFDSVGRQVRVEFRGSDANLVTVTQYSYDADGRAECTAIRMNPSVYGNLPASACTLGTEGGQGPDRITKNVYDAGGQLLKVQKAFGTALQQDYVTYTYTSNGKQASVKDANGNLASLTYDGYDRLVQWNFPSKTSMGSISPTDYEQYGYDANGNKTSYRKRDGSTLTYGYDALNRMTVKAVPERGGLSSTHTRDVYYGYDLGGRQLYARFDSMSGEGASLAYDGLGQLASSSLAMDGITRTLSYQWDNHGNRTELIWPDGNKTSYSYDGLDRMSKLYEGGLGSTVNMVSYTYNNQGLRAAQAGRYGQLTSLGYDVVGRLNSFSHDLAGSANDVAYGATFTPASQIASRTTSNDSYAWTGAVTVNRNYAVNGLNQYTSVGGGAITYDDDGNLTSSNSIGYQYDIENRLVSVSGAMSATLRYDPLGRLYEVTGSSGTTRFLYDGDELVAEYNAGGTLLRRYAHGSSVDDPVLWYEGSSIGWARWMHANWQGSVVAVSDSSGGSIATNSYDEWGIPAATNQGRFQYTGQSWLPEIGLYHYKARIYSPTLGRFLQTDPVGYEGGFNLYAYAYNDPISLADSDGKAPNQAGATSYDVLVRQIEANGLDSLAKNGGNENRYFYTETYGWVDVRHFGTAALDVIGGTPGAIEEILGFGNEVFQWGTEWGSDYRSGFSPEDLPSNSAGVDFGQYAADNPKIPAADLFKSWARTNGSPRGQTAPYRANVRGLPANDPSYKGGAGRGSSNPSSTANKGQNTQSTDNGSGSNTSNNAGGCNSQTGRSQGEC